MQVVVSCPRCAGQMLADPDMHTIVACPHCQAHVPLRPQATNPVATGGAPSAFPYAVPAAAASAPGHGKAVTSLVLGICSLFLWLCPLVGLVSSIVGVVLGSQARKIERGGMATAGFVLSIIGLALSAINAVIGGYLGATGQHDLINRLTQP